MQIAWDASRSSPLNAVRPLKKESHLFHRWMRS
jgi:hypothetical protein